MGGLQIFICNILVFANYKLIPFLLAIAFLFFLWNIARYFVIESGNEKSRDKAKNSALYGIIGLVVILSLWGIVNIITRGLFGFSGYQDGLLPDYRNSQFQQYAPGTQYEAPVVAPRTTCPDPNAPTPTNTGAPGGNPDGPYSAPLLF